MTIADQLKIKEIGELQMPSDEEKNMMVAAHLAGIHFADMLMMPLESVREYMDNTEFLFHPPVPAKARNKYVINGRTYTLFKDPSEMTVAQFIDFQQYVKDDNLDIELLSCLLVPKGHKYMDGYDIEDIHKTLRQHLLTRDAIALKSFFTVSSVASLPSILTSSEEVRKKLTRKQRREMRRAARVMRSLKDGAGSLSLMQYQRLIDAAGRPLPL